MNVRFDQVGLMNDIKDRMMMMKRKKEEEKKKKEKKKKKSGSWGGVYVVGGLEEWRRKKREGKEPNNPTKYCLINLINLGVTLKPGCLFCVPLERLSLLVRVSPLQIL